MFVERRLSGSGIVELWRCQWENLGTAPARKVFVEKIGEEQPITLASPATEVAAICWSYGRTLGNIAVQSPSMLGHFPSQSGHDAILPCEFVEAGKFRHGAIRWWCRTHQTHWGTNGDVESLSALGEMRCANHEQPMNYVVGPQTINVDDFAEVGVWCSMPAALSTSTIANRPPRIHVHVRPKPEAAKTVDRDFPALSILYSDKMGLFGSADITRVNITPPAAFDFACGLELNRAMSCINCAHCGYPHLDLGDFARKPHRKHFCGNCGRDSTWSKTEIISTPLHLLHSQFAKTLKYETPARELNLGDYAGCTYSIWASTPAVIWTATRPQEFGIHVHVHDGARRVVDDTFGSVILDGKAVDRASLIQSMIDRCLV